MAKLSTVLDQIDAGSLLLPEFQRGYVWNRDQVRGLMRSLYRGYPVGGLLLWETESDQAAVRGSEIGRGVRLLLLDGQQRVTSLYGVLRGRPPRFFEGDSAAFRGLHFNVEDQAFEFYAPTKMRGDDRWVDVSGLYTVGLGPFIARFSSDPDRLQVYLERLNRLLQIRERTFHEEKITGRDMSIDIVVDIFNRVNSGGTELSKGDLALAKLCAQWPDARQAMRDYLQKWQDAGFKFSLDWLMRNVTAVGTGRAVFTALDNLSAEEFQQSLDATAGYIGRFLDTVSSRLGLDHDRVLMGRAAVPVIARLLHLGDGRFRDAIERDKVLYWYVQGALRGRFGGSTETTLAQDYEAVERDGVDGLIAQLERWRGGNLDIQAHDFEGATRGSRFYPMLYLLTRINGARDLATGLELRADMLGRLASLQIHHIFPKAVLHKAGYDRADVNAIANFCFLTQDTNLRIGHRHPAEYLSEAERLQPGVLASQWIPADPALWTTDRYLDFLAARRELLAEAAQSFLSTLRKGTAASDSRDLSPVSVIAVDDAEDARSAQVKALVLELNDLGYASPELDNEISDPVTGRSLAVAEAFWPDGLQAGLGRPVVLELDPDHADLARLEELDYEVFTSVDALRGYVLRRNVDLAGDQVLVTPSETDEVQSSASRDFDIAMRNLYQRARQEANYSATYFLSMLAEYGGIETARRLLHAPTISDGFATLWERGRLDLTVEALVNNPEFHELFTTDELAVAHRRLEQFGYLDV